MGSRKRRPFVTQTRAAVVTRSRGQVHPLAMSWGVCDVLVYTRRG